MKTLTLSLPPLTGLAVLDFPLFGDDRGFFSERFHLNKVKALFESHGVGHLAPMRPWTQVNHSRSAPGVLRGLHYQAQPMPQGKWVMCLTGKIFDVAVDLRSDSPTQGQWHGVELDGDQGRVFWIPAGFAHGFYVLPGAPADVLYLCDSVYSPESEGGVRFDDPEIGITWPNAGSTAPILSPKDERLPTLAQFRAGTPRHF